MQKFIKKFFKRFTILLAAILASMVLVFSVTMANLFLTGKIFHEKKFVKTEVSVKKVEEVEKKIEKKRTARKPNRQKSNSRSPKAGPRFAMALGAVSGTAGAAINSELVADFEVGLCPLKKAMSIKSPKAALSQTFRCRRKSETAKSMLCSASVSVWMLAVVRMISKSSKNLLQVQGLRKRGRMLLLV